MEGESVEILKGYKFILLEAIQTGKKVETGKLLEIINFLIDYLVDTSESSVLGKLKNMKELQESSIISDYMTGLFNGIELSISLIEKRDPVFKNKPAEINALEETKDNYNVGEFPLEYLENILHNIENNKDSKYVNKDSKVVKAAVLYELTSRLDKINKLIDFYFGESKEGVER